MSASWFRNHGRFQIRDVDFSPDGSLIAYSTGQSENMGEDFRVAAVDPLTGVTHELSPQRFFNIAGLSWLPDQTSLLIAAAKGQTMNYRIWKLDLKAGTAEPLTKDAEWYRDRESGRRRNEPWFQQTSLRNFRSG